MSQALPVIVELETALKGASVERQIKVLQSVTDLFLTGHDKVTEDIVAVYDEVILRLVDLVERRALKELGERFAPIANAPPKTMRRLAGDDDIEIAGPVLAQSQRLSDQDLVELSGSKAQSHLGRIAERARLAPAVTDVIIDHGERAVVNKVAANAGARFSRTGMSMLVMRANGDDELTLAMGERNDIPPALYRQLLAHATEQARQRLLASAKPGMREIVNNVLSQVAAQTGVRPISQKYEVVAQRLLEELAQDTALTQSRTLEFADGKQIGELLAALTVLSALPLSLVSRLVFDAEPFGVMVLCKAIRLDWSVAHAILTALPAVEAAPATDFEQLYEDYEQLSVSSANHLLGYWKSRQMRQKL